jgi:hypothetical protein
LRGFILFKWKDSLAPPELGSDPWPLHTGLLDADGAPKPGFWAFAGVVRMLRSGAARQGSAALARVSRRTVRLSPLAFAAVGLGCQSDDSGACAGVLRLRSARAVWCGGRRLAAGVELGSAEFSIAVTPAIAPVRLRTAARRAAQCAGRIRVRATVAAVHAPNAAASQSVEFDIRAA